MTGKQKKLTIVETNKVIKVMSGRCTDGHVVLLRYRIFLGKNALASHCVMLNGTTKIPAKIIKTPTEHTYCI